WSIWRVPTGVARVRNRNGNRHPAPVLPAPIRDDAARLPEVPSPCLVGLKRSFRKHGAVHRSARLRKVAEDVSCQFPSEFIKRLGFPFNQPSRFSTVSR